MQRMDVSDGYGNEDLWREVRAMKESVKELEEKTTKQNDSLLTQLNDLNAFINLNVPPVVNYANNGDFVFEQEDYEPGSNYTNDHLDCAQWYFRANNSSSQYTEHTTTVQSGYRVSTDDTRDAW